MHRSVLAGILVVAASVMPAAYANAQDFHANFSGFQEIGGLGAGETGAILSNGQATLALQLNQKLKTLNYTLTYSNLGTQVTQAHIHFGRVHVAGGIMVFFCSNLAAPPPGTQLCPPSGTISGMLTAANVIGPAAQNVTAGDFDAVTAALLSNSAYANIHTVKFPAGEIRGQIHRDEPDDNNQQ